MTRSLMRHLASAGVAAAKLAGTERGVTRVGDCGLGIDPDHDDVDHPC